MSRLKEGVEMFSKLALPLVVAAVGFYFNYIQEQNAKQQLALERNTRLLQQLASDDPVKKKGALIVMDYLVKKGQIQPELVASALFQAAGDSDQNVANLASATLKKVAGHDHQFKQSFRDAAQADTTISEYFEAAHIESKENFTTCENVENKNPIKPTDQFNSNNIWLWARVHAPLDVELLRLEWVDLQTDSVFATMNPKVRQNMTTGYRISYSKNMPGPGDYEVRLFNSYNQLMAERKFRVNQLTAK